MQRQIKRSHFIVVQVLLWESEVSDHDGPSVGDFSMVRESLTGALWFIEVWNSVEEASCDHLA